MKIAKTAALALAVILVSLAPVFAGPKDIPAGVIPKQTVTLQVFSQLANYSGIQTGWFADVMLEKFNVKLNIISQPAGSGILQTRMEAGNLGDLVIWGNDQEDYVNAYKAGLLFNWDDEKLLDTYGPYIKANMPYALEKNRKISGGKLYGFGFRVSANPKERQEFFYTWDLRFDLYEKLGKPRIKNLDDLVNVLERMKKICPKDDNGNPTYGVSLFNDWDGNMVMYVKSTATAYYGYDEFDFGLYDPSTKKYYHALEKGGPYLTALKFYNKLNQKGLVDPDSQTQKYNGQSEDFQNGTAFFTIFNWMGSGTYNSEAHLKAGKGMFPVAPEQATPIAYGQNIYGGNRIWSIGATTKYPELCMAILNWFSTPEGFLTCQWGPKGVVWDYDKNGKTYLTELGKKTTSDPNGTDMPPPYSGKWIDGSFKINNETWSYDANNPDSKGETYNWRTWASSRTPAKTEIEAAWRKWAKADTPDAYLGARKYILAPGTMFTEDPVPDNLKVKWNQVADAIKNYSWKAIYAKTDAEFDSIVAAMTKEVYSYGFDEILAFTKTQVARRAAAEDAVTKAK
jgi:multiple sugar transport system substrate-binding protein/putative aldouronate transport system substrate-binding protein